MKKTRVGFQGEHGAYSEAAIYSHFPSTVEAVPNKTIREVFNMIEAGVVDYGVVPVENSIEGSVYETYDMLLTSSVKVAGEVVLRVIHCLIALPGAKLTDIKRVFSHPQALGQCKGFIASLSVEPIVMYDTAGSVKLIKEKGMKDAAAVGSENAAQMYGMKILAKGIEDYGRNFTRFLVISKSEARRSKDSKTSVIFSVTHTPGSLYKAIQAFAKNGINLTKIESRPTRQRPWEYYFFLDFEGHREDGNCALVLGELAKKTVFLKVLGSYPRSKTELF